MTASVLGAAVQLGGGLLAGPLAAGAVQHLKAVLQGRPGPATAQRYRELRRLWRKGGVSPELAGEPYRLAPALAGVCTLLAILMVPVGGLTGSWGIGDDALLLVGLLALPRFALALAAWDTGSAFALMGASRDLTFAVFAEATLLLVILLTALPAGGDTSLAAMSTVGAAAWEQPIHVCAALAYGLVALAETGRQPFDNPDTHLELTMVHEGPLLEYAGRELALLQWAADARLWLVLLLGTELFVPRVQPLAAGLAVTAAVVALLCVAVAVTETVLAKMRILRVPTQLLGGAALCLVGLVTRLAQGGS